jgi:hypothetical protein
MIPRSIFSTKLIPLAWIPEVATPIRLRKTEYLASKPSCVDHATAKIMARELARIGLPLEKIHAKYAVVSAEPVKVAVICRPLRGDWRFFFHS